MQSISCSDICGSLPFLFLVVLAKVDMGLWNGDS